MTATASYGAFVTFDEVLNPGQSVIPRPGCSVMHCLECAATRKEGNSAHPSTLWDCGSKRTSSVSPDSLTK